MPVQPVQCPASEESPPAAALSEEAAGRGLPRPGDCGWETLTCIVTGLWDIVHPDSSDTGGAMVPSRPPTSPIPCAPPASKATQPTWLVATSPVTVIVPERSDSPHVCACQRPPSGSRQARGLRVEAAQLIHQAYCALVRDGTFMWTDIDEGQSAGRIAVQRMIMCSPEQDAMGVLSGALHIMRYVLSDSYLEKELLSRSVRYRLAAILMIAYKLKSDGWWSPTAPLAMSLVARFLLPPDLGPWAMNAAVRANHEDRLHEEEGAMLVSAAQLHTLVEGSVYSAAELALTHLLRANLVHPPHAVLALGTVYFYVGAAMQNEENDVLEQLGATRTTEELGAALALLGVLAQTLKDADDQCRRNTIAHDVELIVEYTLQQKQGPVASASARLAENALFISKRMREGAYGDCSTRIFPFVADAMVERMAKALRPLG